MTVARGRSREAKKRKREMKREGRTAEKAPLWMAEGGGGDEPNRKKEPVDDNRDTINQRESSLRTGGNAHTHTHTQG